MLTPQTSAPTPPYRPVPVHDETTDEACIAAIAGGNRQAMNQLYARHSVRIYRFIVRLTGSTTIADDLVSEVFLAAWQQASRFEGRSRVVTWLLGIARNKAMSALRGRHDKQLDETALAQLEDPSDDPEAAIERAQRCDLLRECLGQLSCAHREVIDLVYFHERSIEEAARIVGIPPATVKTRMFYARQHLAALVELAQIDGPLS